jgi:hypothetical protein
VHASLTPIRSNIYVMRLGLACWVYISKAQLLSMTLIQRFFVHVHHVTSCLVIAMWHWIKIVTIYPWVNWHGQPFGQWFGWLLPCIQHDSQFQMRKKKSKTIMDHYIFLTRGDHNPLRFITTCDKSLLPYIICHR